MEKLKRFKIIIIHVYNVFSLFLQLPVFRGALWDANAIANDDEVMDNQNSKKRKLSSGGEDSSSDEKESRRRKRGKKKSKRRHMSSSDDESSCDTDASSGMKRNNKAMMRSPSPIHGLFFDEADDDGMNHVYRAVKQERIPVGWTEAPCSLCPSFDFCKEGGPVNPPDCTYYGDWLTGGAVAIEDGI
jgi:DNA-directed RNA polymerase III subunit RPC6